MVAVMEPLNVSKNEEEAEEEELSVNWDDWEADDKNIEPSLSCLFCNLEWSSAEALFKHCNTVHLFNFHEIKRGLNLDFYGSIKLINYIRSEVASNKCWSCGRQFQSAVDLHGHLHSTFSLEENGDLPWKDDLYLKPYKEDDALLHSFYECGDDPDENFPLFDKNELLKEFGVVDDPLDDSLEDEDVLRTCSSGDVPMGKHADICRNGEAVTCLNLECNTENFIENGATSREEVISLCRRKEQERVGFESHIAREIKCINDSYFGAYGSFGIHKEMIGDKVRTESYRTAILNNPSLLDHATVMDVGCGTGILSLFAVQAGASMVYAVEASEKMAAVASQVAKDHGLLHENSRSIDSNKGTISVLNCMVEDLGKHTQFREHSVDVLLSEWMGYCLLNESMLSSVLFARDHWLKPCGAILPDVATIFVAGYGKGATDLQFWENVYGFDMSHIGRLALEDAAQHLVIDVVDGSDIVTETSVLKTFDLVTMEPEDMDFTSTIELGPKYECSSCSKDASLKTIWCYGVVLWFDTAFSSRFCVENPTVLSTSPYKERSHWAQTILTFTEPIALASFRSATGSNAAVGAEACPTRSITLRISIARSPRHRQIDLSLEVSAASMDGRERSWSPQVFTV